MITLYRREPPGSGNAKLDFTLFVGPATCYYHNRNMMRDKARSAAFCPTDAQMSLGLVEEAVVEAIGEIEADIPDLKSIMVFTACQSAFAGLDFDSLERAVQEQYGLLCLHHENSRILVPAFGGSDGRRRNGGRDAFVQLARKIPNERTVEGRGLLLLNGSSKFDPGNELYDVARQWGFDWIQSLGDWNSNAELQRARSAAFAIVGSESLLPIAEYLEERFALEYVLMPDTCSIAEVDERYRLLSERFGVEANLDCYRQRAVEAAQLAAAACAGRMIQLAGPRGAAEALAELWVRAEVLDPWEAMRPARRPAPGEGRGLGKPPLRSGDEHFPTSGPGARSGQNPFVQMEALPSRESFWGYCGVWDFMSRLASEVGQA